MSTSTTSSSNGNNRVAIVTGGTANLGKLFAESLAGDGVNLVVHYNSPHRAQEAADVVNELEELGVEAIAHQGDLTDTGQITQLVDATIDRFGKWDVLVNTSGLIIRRPWSRRARRTLTTRSRSTPRSPTSSCARPTTRWPITAGSSTWSQPRSP